MSPVSSQRTVTYLNALSRALWCYPWRNFSDRYRVLWFYYRCHLNMHSPVGNTQTPTRVQI